MNPPNPSHPDASLPAELAHRKRKQFLQQKYRQQLRENTEELRELEMKLRAAYVGKALASQISERDALREQEKLLSEQENSLLEAARLKEVEQKRIQKEREHRRKIQLREDIIQQMVQRAVERSKKYEEFLREKKLLDEISRKLMDEEMVALKLKEARQVQFKKDIEEFVRFRRVWREEHELKTQEEDAKLAEFAKKRETEIAEAERERQEERLRREEISERIGREVVAAYEANLKRRELMEDLLVIERTQLQDEDYRQKLEAQLRKRLQARIELERQRAENETRKQCEQEQERLYREQQMREYAERDRLELLSDEKRRRKILEHRREIEACLDERRTRRAQEIAAVLQEHDNEVEAKRQMQRMVEEERIRMLQEHATELLGFLPPGILRESDRKFLSLPR